MNKILIDFPERLQSNAFMVWMENEGFELFQKYYQQKMPDEPQPDSIEFEFDESEGLNKHIIIIE